MYLFVRTINAFDVVSGYVKDGSSIVRIYVIVSIDCSVWCGTHLEEDEADSLSVRGSRPSRRP